MAGFYHAAIDFNLLTNYFALTGFSVNWLASTGLGVGPGV